jgi:hypothetical protein
MTTQTSGYITRSKAGHDLEDELAHIPGRPYDWADGLVRAAIKDEGEVDGPIPDEMALARAITGNYSAIYHSEPRKTPLELARLLIAHLRGDSAS